jgi:hypothetical protein
VDWMSFIPKMKSTLCKTWCSILNVSLIVFSTRALLSEHFFSCRCLSYSWLWDLGTWWQDKQWSTRTELFFYWHGGGSSQSHQWREPLWSPWRPSICKQLIKRTNTWTLSCF